MFYMLMILMKFNFVPQTFFQNFFVYQDQDQDHDQDSTIKFNNKKLYFIYQESRERLETSRLPTVPTRHWSSVGGVRESPHGSYTRHNFLIHSGLEFQNFIFSLNFNQVASQRY